MREEGTSQNIVAVCYEAYHSPRLLVRGRLRALGDPEHAEALVWPVGGL
jgi:hypothetical protein